MDTTRILWSLCSYQI